MITNKITPALSGRSAMILGMIVKGHRLYTSTKIGK